MASVSLFVFFVLSHLVLLHSAEEEGKRENPYCRYFQCGKLGNISFPFTEMPPPFPFCGLMHVKCDELPHPMIHLPLGDRWSEKRYEVINISYTNTTPHIRVKDRWLWKCLHTNKCNCLDNFALPNSSLISFKLTTPNRTLLKCDRTLHNTALKNFTKMTCRDYNIYFCPSNEASQSFPSGCSSIQLPVNESSHKDELNLTAVFDLELHVSDDCSSCHGKEGKGIDIEITQKCFDAHTHAHS